MRESRKIAASALPHPLATLLQPIVLVGDAAPRIFALECLTRGPRGSRLEQAPLLFAHVRRLHMEKAMDRACIRGAFQTAAAFPYSVAINVNPASLGANDHFASFLFAEANLAGISPGRIIVEIGEQAPPENSSHFADALCSLRDYGVAIAVDDVGCGHSNFRAIVECRPEYLKIDRYFVSGVAHDDLRRAVVRSICDLAAHLGAQVIAEGVEQAEDYDALREVGISLFQGFLFGRPCAASSEPLQDVTDAPGLKLPVSSPTYSMPLV